MKIGYIKDIKTDSSPNTLLSKMMEEGVDKIIIEVSKKHENYQEMLLKSIQDMEKRDVLVINTLDDLGENIVDIISIVKKLDEKDIGIKVLDIPEDPIAKEYDWQLKQLIRKQLLILLEWLKDKEQKDIRKRQVRVIENMKALKDQKGSGRPKKYSEYAKDPEDREIYFSVVTMLENNVPIKKISDSLNISRNTIYSIKEDMENTKQ